MTADILPFRERMIAVPAELPSDCVPMTDAEVAADLYAALNPPSTPGLARPGETQLFLRFITLSFTGLAIAALILATAIVWSAP